MEYYLHLNEKLLQDFLNILLLSEIVTTIDHSTEDLDQLIYEEKIYDIIQLEYELHKNVLLLNKN